MNINLSLLDYVVSYFDTRFQVQITNAITKGNTILGQHNGVDCKVNIDFITNEKTGEVINIMVYSYDISILNDVSINREDFDTCDIYDELNYDNSDMVHYLDNESDDSEDRGESI
jgi:hypothetical protein